MRISRFRTIPVFAAIASAGLVATFTMTTPANAAGTRDAVISAGDKICQASNERLFAAAKTYEKSTLSRAAGAGTKTRKVAKPKEVAAFVKSKAQPELAQTIAQLERLVPPSADAKTYAELIGGAKDALAKTTKDPEGASWNDPFAPVSSRFIEFGFRVCGHPIDDTNSGPPTTTTAKPVSVPK
jgi:hypothetical protein